MIPSLSLASSVEGSLTRPKVVDAMGIWLFMPAAVHCR